MVSARREIVFRLGLARRLGFDGLILMYHRFGPPGAEDGLSSSIFAEHLDFLDQHFTVASLAEVMSTEPSPTPRVAITVDDGYASFFHHAWPELRRRGMTATVFLPTGFIGGTEWMWQDRNKYLLLAARPETYILDWLGKKHLLDTTNANGLKSALALVYESGRQASPAERWELTRNLEVALGRQLPEHPPERFSAMAWDQVHELRDHGVEFGSHTCNHAILTTCGPEQARSEIIESRRILAREIDGEVSSFAYPNGDFDRHVRATVADAGYSRAVSTIPGFWSPGADPFAAPRIHGPYGGARVLADMICRHWYRHGAPRAQQISRSP
jgi:peptidoglycan/xylan/chitin deacetylase (PgdA/CDA1 family)